MKQWIKTWIIMVMVLLAMVFAGCSKQDIATHTVGATSTTQTETTGKVAIKVLDIGQGDAILLKVGNEYSLIDTGDVDHRTQIVGLLKSEGVRSIKNVIITHPHADHMGGFLAVIKNFPIENVYDIGVDVNTNTFKTYEKWIAQKGVNHKVLKKGDTIDFGNGAIFTVFAPWNDKLTDKKGHIDLNNNSIVGKFTFGKFSMLFTGDAEQKEEARLIKEQNTKMSSRILKVGHHGSNGSSSKDFIRSVRPEIAIVSCGLHNTYGHPGDKTLQRLKDENVKIYRTDTMGTVTVVTDGKEWHVSTER